MEKIFLPEAVKFSVLESRNLEQYYTILYTPKVMTSLLFARQAYRLLSACISLLQKENLCKPTAETVADFDMRSSAVTPAGQGPTFFYLTFCSSFDRFGPIGDKGRRPYGKVGQKRP
jgi:hypothetical protein